jgi:hypothetical protein
MLALATLFIFTGCDMISSTPKSEDIYKVVNTSQPTTITTQVSYAIPGDVTLTATYITKLDGDDSIFEYEYQRLATSADVELYPDSYVITKSGKTYYKDGLYSYNEGDTWEANAPASAFCEFYGIKIVKTNLHGIEISEDGKMLTASIKPRKINDALGVDISLEEDGMVDIVVKTNGTRLTDIEISYVTAAGATVIVGTSYSYSPNDLFPDADE